MEQVSIIGIDTSKRSFQLHGSTAEGIPVFRKTLSRGKLLSFLAGFLGTVAFFWFWLFGSVALGIMMFFTRGER